MFSLISGVHVRLGVLGGKLMYGISILSSINLHGMFWQLITMLRLTMSSGGKMASCVGSYGVKSSALNSSFEPYVCNSVVQVIVSTHSCPKTFVHY